jgi:threonine dehydrogenase-like Zn-dependent dehydrogenase
VRPGGTVVVAGLKGPNDIRLQSTDLLIWKGITLKGAFSLNAKAYNDAISLIESGRLPLDRIKTHRVGLGDAEHAIKVLAGEVPGESAIHIAIMPQR